MARNVPTKAVRGAVVTGATASGAKAVGAVSLGTISLGAAALGALAIGALAIGRLRVGRARFRRVEIGELAVGRLAIGADGAGRLTAMARVRAVAGMGDALARLLHDETAGSGDASLIRRVHRSAGDPDDFLFCASYADAAALESEGEADALAALLRQAAAAGLVATDSGIALYERLRAPLRAG